MSRHKYGSVESEETAAVVVVGAGPTGLMTANLLGIHGVDVVVLESEQDLIDYPRGVGMDDETLRTFQLAGLVDAVLPHTVPDQLLVFVDARQRVLARMAPPSGEFGWPRRNGFVQPLADRVLLDGLDRFDHVDIRWSSRVTGFTQDADGVLIDIATPSGERKIRASYVVGADGGRSESRKALGLSFTGSSSSAQWLVVDIRNDPWGRPGAYVCADPHRPYVSISIPHGIRRFEFMLKPGETDEIAITDEFVASLLSAFIPPRSEVDIIRRRVYTHHARIAERFGSGHVFLVGDAAHLMPVWQGQGYNSGIRDALNLSWKLAMVVRGQARPELLSTYEVERRDHVKAMIALSNSVGRAVSVTNPATAAIRDIFFHSISLFPAAKRYIVQMRFKPMPTMDDGALTSVGVRSRPSPVGRLFIQPAVCTQTTARSKLDDAIGPWFALIVWNNDPHAILDEDALARLANAGVRLVAARPAVQLDWTGTGRDDSVLVVGDLDGSLKRWFDERDESVILVRPDRIVGGATPAHAASEMVRAFAQIIRAPQPTPIDGAAEATLSTAAEPTDSTVGNEPSVILDEVP